jgi:L-2-hydroxyglutarate oxidase
MIRPEKAHLVKNLIYPVPDPRFPFLGVHFTRTVQGEVEAGPNAVLAFKREGYTRLSFSARDVLTYLTFSGFWKMSARYWQMGMAEMYRSFSKAAFVRALQKLIPAIQSEDIIPGGAGVRAQALDQAGQLLDDFRIMEQPGMIHVLNAPSPAATASLSIGATIAQKAQANFGL